MSMAVEAIADTGGVNVAHRREMLGRVGHDEEGREVRSFHVQFGSVKAGQPPSRGWQAAVDYAAREGKYAEGGELAEKAADVLYTAGEPDDLRGACRAIDASITRRKGRTAERVLVKQIVELPSDVDDEKARWKAAANSIVADWKKRGHEAVAAVHLHGEERDHPHLHVLVAARPVDEEGNVDRGRALLIGKDAVKAERRHMADLVNEACDPEVPVHAGQLREIGIDRDPRRRIPQGTFRKVRAKIREALASRDEALEAGDEERAKEAAERADMLDAAMRVASEAIRTPLHEERRERYQARRPEIEAAREAGEWPRPTMRQRLEKVTAERDEAERLLAHDDPTASADAIWLDVPPHDDAISVMRQTPGVGYDARRGQWWIAADHEHAGLLREHFGAVDPRPLEQPGVTYLSVPPTDRDRAVETGARFDRAASRFFVPPDADPADFAAWRGSAAAAKTRVGREEQTRLRERLLGLRPEEARPAELEEERTARKKAEERAAEAESRARSQTEKQTAWLIDAHEDAGRPVPDLTTEEGLSQAWAFVRAVTQAGIDHERRRAEEKKRREAAESAREKDAAAAADKAARLAANPYRDTPEGELRAAFREEGLGRANALRDSRDRRAPQAFRDQAARDLADIEKKIEDMRQAADLRGIELAPKQATSRPRGRQR